MDRRPIIYTQTLIAHGTKPVAIDLCFPRNSVSGRFVLRVDDVEVNECWLVLDKLSAVERLIVGGLSTNEIVGKTAEELAFYLYWQLIIMRDEQLDFLRPAPETRKWVAEQRLWIECAVFEREHQYDISRTVRDYSETKSADDLIALSQRLHDPTFCAALEAAVIAGRGLALLAQQGTMALSMLTA